MNMLFVPAFNAFSYEIGSDHLSDILRPIGNLIGRVEQQARQRSGDPLHYEFDDVEIEYIEDLIGAAFLMCQTQIRRVITAARKLTTAMWDENKIDIPDLKEAKKIMKLGGGFRGCETTAINYIWEVTNYFKHRDEWQMAGHYERRSTETLKTILDLPSPIVDIDETAFNMRVALETLGISSASDCPELDRFINEWKQKVEEVAKDQILGGRHI